jgi:ATP-dependent helicase/nuclease subunit A
VKLTVEQERAARANGSVAVTAGAGTGKTYMLSERYLHHLETGLSPLEIVAVTFTEKAAMELRARIRTKVAERLTANEDVMAELEAAQISTVHALAARICRDHSAAAEVPPDFNILDELEGMIQRSQWLEDALDKLPTHIYEHVPYSLIRPVLEAFFNDPISAARALQHDSSEWPTLVAQAKEDARRQLLDNGSWQTTRDLLSALKGKAGDKMEDARLIALGAIAGIEQNENLCKHLEAIQGIKLVGGSQKSWSPGELEAIKESLRNLRELVNATVKEGLVTLDLRPVDDQLAAMLPVLREAFEVAKDYVDSAKRRARVLDFADLEVHALRALEKDEVRSHYAERWKAFLVDEFQDTNPVQAEILRQLTEAGAILTIVGDEKQSIYGFRRADVTVFRTFRERITGGGGEHQPLSLSFRTHEELIKSLNHIFSSVLGDLHQELTAERSVAPHPGPHLRSFVIRADKGINKPQRQLAEARHIANLIRKMLDDQVIVHDKRSGLLRPVRPGDFAILSRTWEPLDACGEAIASCDIPVVHARGGNLLDTREAKDGWAMLRFLADPQDSVALVAALRSPFFAVSDRVLLNVAQGMSDGAFWWGTIKETILPELAHPRDVLTDLLKARRFESPSRLLQLANRLTGYCAVIANLPNAERREADWRGFFELVLKMEHGINDLSVLMRQLKRVADAGGEIPRPPVEAQNSVALMTIHGSKGLEWPVVIILDLARERPNTNEPIRFDPELGVALRLENEQGETLVPALTTLLEHKQKRSEIEEARRVLYVALTRAQDHLILSSTEGEGGSLDLIMPGLEAADIFPEIGYFDPEKDVPYCPPDPAHLTEPSRIYTESLGSGVYELTVSALGDYAQCPLQFRYKHIDGHPGLGEEWPVAQRIGSLMHKAIARNIKEESSLARYDRSLPLEYVREALDLSRCFHEDQAFATCREQPKAWNQTFFIRHGGIMLQGVIDLVGTEFVVDYKSDWEMWAQHHRFKVWAYALAARKPIAHIAYIRHKQLHTIQGTELDSLGLEIEHLIGGIVKGDYQAKPSYDNCRHCSFAEVCDQRYQELNVIV